jgi:hypothetical protein
MPASSLATPLPLAKQTLATPLPLSRPVPPAPKDDQD